MKPRQVLDIFTVQRKTEPKSLVILRTIITVLFFAILIGYMYVQIVDAQLNKPVFATVHSRGEEQMIPMPNLSFTYRQRLQQQLKITCEINGSKTKKDCSSDLKLNETTNEVIFKAGRYNFTKEDIEKLEFTFTLNDSSQVGSGVEFVELRIFDSQSNVNISNYKDIDENLLSLIDLNLYRLFSNQSYLIELTRIRRNVTTESLWNFLGIPPNYSDETYLTSVLESNPYTPVEDSTVSYAKFAKLTLAMRSWRVAAEEEQKAKTLFDTLGQIAGVAGTLSIFYAFLFGVGPNAIHSWGIVQKIKWFGIKKGVKKHINRRYPRLPFVHTPKTGEDEETDKDEDITDVSNNVNDSDEILERLDAIERFLKEFVVDVDLLEQLEKLNDENIRKQQNQEQ